MKPAVTPQVIQKVQRWQFISAMFGCFLLFGAVIGFMAGWNKVKEENLLILTFHGITDSPVQPWEIPYQGMLDIINGLKQHKFIPLSPWDLEPWLSGVITGGRRFLITFDDGLASSKEAILRLSREEQIQAGLFVILDLLGKPGYVSADDLRALASDATCRIELHGQRHVSAPEILKNGEDLAAELTKARWKLEQILVHPQSEALAPESSLPASLALTAQAASGSQTGSTFPKSVRGRGVSWYAYPYGDYNEDCQKAAASAGLTLGFTIDARSVGRDDPRLLLPRLMYLQGAKEAGEAVPQDWMPPWSAQAGSLTITLSVLIFFLCIRMFQRALILGHRKRQLARAWQEQNSTLTDPAEKKGQDNL